MPKLPGQYRPRVTALNTVKAKLIASEPQNIGIAGTAIATGLLGMGGIGKTVLATALVHDCELKSAFPGGIAWLNFGRNASVVAKQAELAFALSGKSTSFRDSSEGRGRLGVLTAGLRQRLLIVLDDVWQVEAADGFVGLGSMCRLLVTTRDRRVLERLQAHEHEIGLLDPDEARAFLAEAAGVAVGDLPADAEGLLHHCGRLPLALAAVGALIRRGTYGWTDVLAALRAAALEELDTSWLPDYEQHNLAVVLKVSVDTLSPRARPCFLEYAVFPEDVSVPESVLVRLWSDVAGGERRAKLVAQELVDRSLLRRDEQRQYLVHDLYYDYLQHAAAPLAEKNLKLVQKYWQACPNGWASGPGDGYFFEYLPHHLAQVGRAEDLVGILTDAESLNVLRANMRIAEGSYWGAQNGLRIKRFIEAVIAVVPKELYTRSQRFKNISDNVEAFASCLSYGDIAPRWSGNQGPVCHVCKQGAIAHWHKDFGAVDFYDNYYVICLNCFWSWHREFFSTVDDPPFNFNYATNTYWG
jgi:hypothetical protein